MPPHMYQIWAHHPRRQSGGGANPVASHVAVTQLSYGAQTRANWSVPVGAFESAEVVGMCDTDDDSDGPLVAAESLPPPSSLDDGDVGDDGGGGG